MYVLALCIFQTNFKCMNEWMNENIPEIYIIDISFAEDLVFWACYILTEVVGKLIALEIEIRILS